ncbi:MAG: hypothetical protein ACREEQ_12520, partial [Caulobacteraceae bacterium]
MKVQAIRIRNISLVVAVFCAFGLWLEPSIGELLKYFSPTATAALALLGFAFVAFVFLARGWTFGWAPRLIRERPLACLIVLLVLIFAALYPVSQSGLIGGGSDEADALRVTFKAWLTGHDPYQALTYAGQPADPMPGAILLAAPFSLFDQPGLQNLLWIPLFIALTPTILG